jgi:hypothetical protein
MEGSYSKVWRSRDQVPQEEYRFFVDGLMETIRHEIASCEEKAYDSLPLNDAATLLFFDRMQQVSDFANEVSKAHANKVSLQRLGEDADIPSFFTPRSEAGKSTQAHRRSTLARKHQQQQGPMCLQEEQAAS